MIIYLSVYIVLLCVAFFEFFDDRVTNHYLKLTLFVTVILYLLVLTGSRFEVGADFSSYFNIFNRVNTLAEGAAYSSLEPGFKLIILFFKGLNFPPYLLFFVFAAILFTFLGKGLYRSSKLPFLSLFIFVMVFWIGYVFNVLRQGIAMAILIYLIKDIHERNFKKVLFFSLVASTIHFTGVFILIGYFIYPLFLRQSVFIGMTLMSIVYYLNSMVFFDLIASLLPGGLQAKLIDYMSRFPGGVDLTSYLLRLIILGIFLWFYKSLENEKQFTGLFNIYFLGFVLYTLLSFQVQAATRVNMFFRVLEILLFPYLVFSPKQKPQKIIMFSLALALGTVLFLSDLSHPANFPFRFFWSLIE